MLNVSIKFPSDPYAAKRLKKIELEQWRQRRLEREQAQDRANRFLNLSELPLGLAGIQYFDSLLANGQSMVRTFQVAGPMLLEVDLNDGFANLEVYVYNEEVRYDLVINLGIFEPDVLNNLKMVKNIVFEVDVHISNFNFNECGMEIIIFKKKAEIGEAAFSENESLKSVQFRNAASIGTSAFSDCEKLETVDFQEPSTIGQGAFFRCPSLKHVYMPDAYALSSSDRATIEQLLEEEKKFIIFPRTRPSGNLHLRL